MAKTLVERIAEMQESLDDFSDNALLRQKNLKEADRLSDLLPDVETEEFNYSVDQAMGFPVEKIRTPSKPKTD